jgi:membrane-associated phospholipid phosphatase
VPTSAQDPTPQAAPPPQPEHTGFRALAKDTLKDFASFPRRRSTWVILGVGGALAALAHPADTHVTEQLVASRGAGPVFAAGKYMGAFYVQMGVAMGIYTIGRYALPPSPDGSKTNKWSHLGFDLLRVQFVSQGVVHAIKSTVRRDRPNGECCAFPSGHAATAFAVASVLERHLGYRFAWPTVFAAMYVATSRLHDNKHYLSDVLFGAAVGTAAGWTVVGRHGRDSYALVPQPVRGGMALMAVRTFR